ncbi:MULTISPECIES: CPBP family intramembrane glutamic endopeptidase [unclassified Mycobacterium]|uniref:Rv0804 family intramembrane glutamic endopeptidase n=1 Tax=unclassified Mycobacterium TaxID=2642494 RepID=UPI00073FF7F1|nr:MULTISPECIES: CPBP family intramembrane glutamic endopeptidase [unclassified Mycobacterium]KUH80782.1 abortive phage infection protein [Mycobacterium sp. GA-0227b]KUH92422.1 abortive phage infection protein [Mycobacterium sp. GA-1999]KUH92906.1 abortive phage infection protein [Mycobacterium sp. IS-1556]
MAANKFRAAAVAVALVGWSFIAPRVRFHPIANAALGTGLYALARPPLGLRPPALWSGLRHGLAAGAVIALGVAAATAVPSVRGGMAARELPDRPVRWMAFDIPVGTVWPEEVAYRATLGTAAETAFEPVGGRFLQSVAFGLWHIMDARLTRNPVLGTVLLTGVAGWAFGWLHARSGSLAAPMLAHLAANEAAALAALAVQRRIESRA